MNKLTLTSISLLSIHSSIVSAEPQELSRQVVVADRVAGSITHSAQVMIIEREEIERSGAQSIVDLLKHKEGIQFSSNGGIASTTNLYINGLDSKQIVFLINGIRTGSATTGGSPFQLIPVDQIERIEIFKGSRATIYGANAQGGVINIITRHSGQSNSVSASISSQSTREVSLRVGQHRDNWSSYLNLTHNESDGYNIRTEGDDDKDGFRRNGISSGASLQISPEHRAGFDLQANIGFNEYDNTFGLDDRQDTDNRTYTAWYEFVSERLNINLQTGSAWDRSWNFEDGQPRRTGSHFATKQQNTLINSAFHYNFSHTVLFGLDHKKLDVSSSSAKYDETDISNQGAYIGYRFTNEYAILEASSRYDNNEQFGDFWSFDLSAILTFNNGDSMGFGHSTGFRAPTFNELYFPNFGNEDLKVEQSKIWSAHYTAPWATGLFRVNGQRAIIDNQIVSNPNNSWKPDNISESAIKSISASIEQNITNELSIRLVQDWLNAKDLTTGQQLLRRSPRSSKGVLSWTNASWYAEVDALYRSESKDVNNSTNPSYVVFSTIIRYQLNPKGSIGLRIDNVGDRDYETIAGYPEQGRLVQLSGRYHF
ncbi:MAG: TonB-dependent receptor [Bacterioplanes sp.]|nr:TonB-dependent receptor [Bacterioplanes sp.]